MTASDKARAPALVKAVLGPTNTGKTHLAIERMLAHADGMIGLPLRLLAREVFDRVVRAKGAGAAALITGEEKIAPECARYFVCTVEAMPLDRRVEFLAVDEIQLARDPDRGHIFTNRILHARGLGETMLLGSDTMRPMIRRLLPKAEITRRERLSTLSYAGPRKLTKLPKRAAIVAFSAEEVYAIAELIRRHRGGAAVVMGALSPRTRNAQVALYQNGEVDFLVATDAIGMGLNMDVDHVAFASYAKFDGRRNRVLRPDEVAQIAGRAGRFENDGKWGETGECPPFDEETIERVESHEFEPVEAVEWRNEELEFASLAALLKSLERPPSQPGLVRARGGDDEEALKRLMLDEALLDRTRSTSAVKRFWEACMLPDFRKSGIEEHARLVGRVAEGLLSPNGCLPEDWIAPEVARLDRTEGDLDVLQQRLAHVRTWAYAANRNDWLDDAAHWRERTRAIEDRLSDALHDTLTQRFIDRRTSALLRGLKREEALVVEVSGAGDVIVESHAVGRLDGLSFKPDPTAFGLEGRAVRNAAIRALAPEIAHRLTMIAGAEAEDFSLEPDGSVTWRAMRVAALIASPPLKPKIAMEGAEDADAALKRRAAARIEAWLAHAIEQDLSPLLALQRPAGLEGAGRGLAFRLLEAGGALDRAEATELVAALAKKDRSALARIGVRIGRHSIYAPSMLKPRAAQLWSLVRAGVRGEAPFLVRPGAISAPAGAALDWERLATAGFRHAGPAVVRLDRIERLAALVPRARGDEADIAAMARIIGRPEREVPEVLKALGYRQAEGRWIYAAKRAAKKSSGRHSPFAALAELVPPAPPRARRRPRKAS